MRRRSFSLGASTDRLHDLLRELTAPLDAVAALVPRTEEGLILELGAGQGLLAERLAGRAARLVAVDFDERKCRMARARLARFSGVTVVGGELEAFLRGIDAASVDAVVLADTLSSIPEDAQRRVLAEIARVLRKGGVVVLKIVDTEPRWKAAFARALSLGIYRIARASVTADDRFHHRSHTFYEAALRELGFDTEVVDLARHRPIPHVAVVGRRR